MYRISSVFRTSVLCAVAAASVHIAAARSAAAEAGTRSIIQRVEEAGDRIELTAGTSRVLTLDLRIPRAQVNNEEILELTALSPNQLQISALNPGITQIIIWDEKEVVHSIDVAVFGDVRALQLLLQSQFPNASITATAMENSVILSGFIDRPDDIGRIIEIAQDYYPKVINNIQVGGVHQVLLHTKVMEVSRTKLRRLSVDQAIVDSSAFALTSVSGLINAAAFAAGGAGGNGAAAAANTAALSANDTIRFGVVDGDSGFFGLIDFLQQNNVAKILAEPTLMTYSGRPAFFNDGGEFPIPVPQSLGTVSIEYKRFGTQIDFVPIVLGNGRIRLEVRPRISEIDPTRSIILNGSSISALRVREADAGLELRAGQTMALAGLIQTRVEAETSAIPWLGELPYIGVPFRRVQHTEEELELLILVTPELVDGMEPHEVPPCGPGQETGIPTDHQLFVRGHIEVPACTECGVGPGTGPGAIPPGYAASLPTQNSFTEGGFATVSDAPAARNIRPSNRLPFMRSGVTGVEQGVGGQRRRTPPQFPSNQQSRYETAPTSSSLGNASVGDSPSFFGPVGYDVDS